MSFSSSDAVTNATVTGAAPEDNIEALAKGGYEEEVVDGVAGANGLFDLRRAERWIRRLSFSSSALLNKLISQS